MIAYDTYLHDEDQTCVEPEWQLDCEEILADLELEELKGA